VLERCESVRAQRLPRLRVRRRWPLLVGTYLALNWLTVRVVGSVAFLTGCRWGYRIALGASAAAWIIFNGRAITRWRFLLTFMRFLELVWLELTTSMIGICLLSAVAGLAGLIRRDGWIPDPGRTSPDWRGGTESEHRHLFQAIRQIAQFVKCDMPRMSSSASIQR